MGRLATVVFLHTFSIPSIAISYNSGVKRDLYSWYQKDGKEEEMVI